VVSPPRDAVAKAKKQTGPTCTKQQTGSVEADTLAAQVGPKPPYVLSEMSSNDQTSNAVTFHQAVTRGKKSVLTIDASLSAGNLSIKTTYGSGFKGVTTSEVTNEGQMFRAVVDGRRTVLFSATTDPKTITFEDGQPAPKLRVKANVKKALAKFALLRLDTCEKTPKSAVHANDSTLHCPYTDEFGLCEPFPHCNDCGRLCFASYISCGIGAIASAAACGPCAFFSGASCIEEVNACNQACEAPGHPCCPLECDGHCSGGAPGDQCCGGEGCQQDECCGGPTNPFCCSDGKICADPKGICCPTDHGDVCNNTCCPSGQSCLDGFAPNSKVCCPTGDNACGPDDTCCPSTQDCCGSNCCGPGQTCILPATCCNTADLCGDTCCPSHNCLNGTTCCDAPKFQCGANCCGALSTCCNGECCDGQCVNGTCCPLERQCGTSCCAPGFACTDPSAGTCQQCPVAQSPCQAGLGEPTCCPTGTECCGNGACCDTNAGMACCQNGGVVGCFPPSSCIR